MSDTTMTIPNATPCYSNAYGDYVLLLGADGEDGVIGAFGEGLYLALVHDARPVAWSEVRHMVADWTAALAARDSRHAA